MELLLILLGLFGATAAVSLFEPSPGSGGTDDDILDNPSAAHSSGAFYGGPGDNEMRASGDASISGGKGEDSLWAGDDATAYGGNGGDRLILSGDATGYGGAGDDTMKAWGTSDAFGGEGGDVLTTGIAATGHGGAGNDTLNTRGEAWGDDGNDVINIELSGNTAVSINGGEGDDTLSGYASGDGLSSVYGGGGADRIGSDGFLAYGGEGEDTIFADYGRGYGDAGNDVILARNSYGGAGNDHLTTSPVHGEGGVIANSEAYGGDGNDTLIGYGAATYEFGPGMVLNGGAGDDVAYAYGGDTVDMGAGDDTVFTKSFDLAKTMEVTLGSGADDLVMSLQPAYQGNDFGGDVVVKDFDPAADHLALIVAPSAASQVQYTITPNVAGNYTEIVFSQTGATEQLTYRFVGITSLSAANIALYADEAAVAAGTSYQNLA